MDTFAILMLLMEYQIPIMTKRCHMCNKTMYGVIDNFREGLWTVIFTCPKGNKEEAQYTSFQLLEAL